MSPQFLSAFQRRYRTAFRAMSPAARRDLAVLAVAGLCVYALAIYVDLFDLLIDTLRNHERWELDEIIMAVMMLSVATVVFAVRRMKESMRDLRLRVAAEEQTRAMASHDALTGLPNRRKLYAELEDALRDASGDELIAVAAVDLDRFKPVNDLYGHGVGDDLLVSLAKAMVAEVGQNGFVARFGGDEFIIVWRSVQSPDELISRLTRLNHMFETPISIAGRSIAVGASIGVALLHEKISAKEALRRADVALFRVKEDGRGRFAFFDDAMDSEVRARNEIEGEIRSALARDTIEPFFQRLVHLSTGETYGFEVLARLRREDGSIVPPDKFIPITEELGLIGEMTQNLMRRACAEARDWPGQPLLSINISPIQLRDASLPQKLLKVLTETGFPPARLQVEITENALVADLHQARLILTSLRNQGVMIALDDFGTGYSSLRHLRELPFDNIKIDRSFVQSMESSAEAETIVHTILDLAKNLGMAVTAEGIETRLSAEILKAWGCANGQGFYYGRPETADTVRENFAEPAAAASQKERGAA